MPGAHPARLKKVACYDSSYLHLIRTVQGDREVSDRAGDLVSSSQLGLIHDAVETVRGFLTKP